jgi:hypothetical protein
MKNIKYYPLSQTVEDLLDKKNVEKEAYLNKSNQHLSTFHRSYLKKQKFYELKLSDDEINSKTDIFNKNNNNNKHLRLKQKSSNKKNSFLSIFSKAYKYLVDDNYENKDKSNFKVDDIEMTLNDKDQIQLKLLIPSNCMETSELNELKNLKKNKSNYAKNSSSNVNSQSSISNLKNKTKIIHNVIANIQDSDEKNSSSDNSSEKYLIKSSNKVNRKNYSQKCLIFLSVLTFIFNPLFGIVAFLMSLKARKVRNLDESKRLIKISRQTSLIGLALGIILTILILSLVYLHGKLILINGLNSNHLNQTTSNQTTKIKLKHKLHYDLSQRIIRMYINQTTTTKITKTTFNENQIIKYYDRISILIDHNFLNKLKLSKK